MSRLLQTELLSRMAAAYPEAVAWMNMADDSELTLGAWESVSTRLARGFRARGLAEGDLIGLAISPDEPLIWLITYMAIHKAGCTAVPLNTRLQEAELVRILRHAQPALLVGGGDVLARCPGIASEARLLATTGDVPPEHGEMLAWPDLLAVEDIPLDLTIDPEGVADVMYTSGTTGDPKGVVVTHGGLSPTDREPGAWSGLGFLTSSPFSTTSGSLLVCGPMRGGLTGWFLPRFDVGRWLDIVSSRRPVVAFVVPAMVQLIVTDERAASFDFSSLAVVNVGSAPIAAGTLRRFGDLLGSAEVLVGYGMTEFGAVTSVPFGDRGRHLGSVGRPLPDVELRIVDEEGADVGHGEVGEVLIRGKRTPRRYFGDEEKNGDTWTDGWLHSGDLGCLDDDGYLSIVGRIKETIIRGGHNVMPGEIEAVLYSHPSVVEAAIAGIPHPVLGEDVAAWVVLTKDSDMTVAQLRSFLLERLADFKVPRSIVLVTALPRNEAGKVLKEALVTDFVATSRSLP